MTMITIRDRQSTRLKRWDYRSPGYYFITICVQERWQKPFGFIKNNMMCLSNIGAITTKYWMDIPKHFSNVTLDQFVIMPDHMHGIIIINHVGTCHGMSLRNDPLQNGGSYNTFSKPIKNSLPMMINQYKSAVTRWCRVNDYPFQWQSRYYEHIIRSQQELENVHRYIINNPRNWQD